MASPQSITNALPQPNGPLMQPVVYEGETYLISQFFHWQYVANSGTKGKHRRYDHFLRLLRSIETYQDHKSLGNIVELEFPRIKAEAPHILVDLKPLFQATGYHPLTLINATAQAALSHHLDDELSKQLSVAINTQAARQSASISGRSLLPLEQADREYKALLSIASMMQIPAHLAHQEAVKMVEHSSGVNLRPLLKAAPSQDHIPDEEVMFEPTELAKHLGVSNAKVVNLLLEQLGWQQRIAGSWQPTPSGEPYAARHTWLSDYGTKTGINYKWRLAALRHALRQAGLLS